MNIRTSKMLREAQQATLNGQRALALLIIYEALEIARQCGDRCLNAHLVQCAERVAGTL